MAIEAQRGCGYRKVGGLYLVAGGVPRQCDRLPFVLTVCPTCHAGFKQSRGWTWVEPGALFGGPHLGCEDERFTICPVCNPVGIDRCGLLWIGGKYYDRPEKFSQEARTMGISRRIHAVPKGFKVGETWVLLAHPKAKFAGYKDHLEENWEPGIFSAFRPERIEKICLESTRGSEEVQKLEERGITPVFVPDNDPDHGGKAEDDEPSPTEVSYQMELGEAAHSEN